MITLIQKLYSFAGKQISSAIFGIFLLALMVVTNLYYPLSDYLHRYDFIFISAIIFQLLLVVFKLENKHEIFVILIFHIVATGMELFKTSDSIGAWHYPEEYIFGINNVPLFTGFMYSAVGSYIARSWKIFDLKYSDYPKLEWSIVLVVLIYINFFSHHYIFDVRWFLIALSFALFYKTTVNVKTDARVKKVPILLVWFIISFLIWIAENISTYANIWLYPNQMNGWKMVSIEKITSWYLLMLLSFVLISLIKLTQKSTIIENYTKFITVTYVVLIPLIILNAGLGYANDTFPFVKDVPGRHHTAHIIVYGGLSAIVNMMTNFRVINVKGINVLLGAVLVFFFVVLEEVSQIWIDTRVFDLWDIVSSLVGIAIFSYLSYGLHKKISRTAR